MSTFNKYRLKGAYHYQWYEEYDWYKYLIDRAVEFCKGSTLEIGCGEGLLLDKIAQNGYDTVGIDNDQDATQLADPELDIRKGDVDTDYFHGEWDYLACINTIEHLRRPEYIKELIENNVTKGAIIITIDYQGGTLGEDHKFEWTYDQMMEFFKEFNPKGFRYKDTEWIGVEITK